MATLVVASLVATVLVVVSVVTPLGAATAAVRPPPPADGLPEVRTKSASGSDYRLPTHLKPIHYRLRLMPFIWPGNFTTAGDLDVSVACLESANNVTLNAKDIEIDVESIAIFEEDEDHNLGRQIPLHTPSGTNSTDQDFIIFTSEPLISGSKYRVQLKFVSHLNDLLQGFYRSSYIDSVTGEKRWLAVTQFSPVDARRAYPCFDEPALKATFQVSIARTTNMTSRSNMPLEMTEPIESMPGWVWDHYPTTVPTPTYLTAFLVSDFETLGKDTAAVRRPASSGGEAASNVSFSIWTRRDALEQTRYARDISPRILAHYEDYFGIPFPLPKVDMVAVPDFGFHAMENWGLITFRESAMLFDPKESTTNSKQDIAMVIGHELAHQWFGNLVTPAWWDDLWLKEGFASYVEYIGVDHVEPTWKILDQFPYNEIQDVFSLDALNSSHPISVEVDDPNQIRQMFDRISYGKGASIIRMMNHFLGEETFRAGLKSYLTAFSYGNAVQDDLWASLTTQAHQDGSLPADMTVKEVMDTWTLQTGFPVVNVARNYEDGSASLSQERFVITADNKADKTKAVPKWWIPVTYTTQDNPNFENTLPALWMRPDEGKATTINGLPKGKIWMLLNIKETGVYRVNYDLDNWALIENQLAEQAETGSIVIPPMAKSQMMDDALNLARAGLLPYARALDLFLTLTKDTDYLPWVSTFRALNYLDLMLTSSPVYDEFKGVMLNVSRLLIDSVGWTADGDHLVALKRASALKWACYWGDADCVREAKARYADWMTQAPVKGQAALNSSSQIPADLQRVVYCTGIKYGSAREWDFAWQRYLSSGVGTQREVLLDSLGCTREMDLLKKYLNGVLDSSSGIRKQDGSRAFAAVAENPLGSGVAFDFLRDNWDQLLSYYGLAFSRVASMVTASTKSMNTADQLNQLKTFWKEQEGNLGSTDRTFRQSIEKVESNVMWMERSFEEVKQWIESHSAFLKSHTKF
ncbi:aminopeptidase N-like [Ischnura elegans]|uniref:aminopeptidase N-like n=1 Tax=Ischnura elegans TaxID=197161 RepID=UPI001ED8B76A|nr:aminopeptidase N-like [Ischnura elegans]XP_046405005.1 aminopeptidase N-like [Ischnura elegans]XP_046405014.1 aminopeptidase N-like [Ischnura elegans]XP_046405020.1 aminopeptidase N-like [Ischnura elegans]XP_046405024.1 aminopeptidase N-like [Ischnura elegans]XP_046405030.1 aminopeptidase N-like [Ischnura elegans]